MPAGQKRALSGILQAHPLVSLELKGLVHFVRGRFWVEVCTKLVQPTLDFFFLPDSSHVIQFLQNVMFYDLVAYCFYGVS